jgi:hypothetical protein
MRPAWCLVRFLGRNPKDPRRGASNLRCDLNKLGRECQEGVQKSGANWIGFTFRDRNDIENCATFLLSSALESSNLTSIIASNKLKRDLHGVVCKQHKVEIIVSNRCYDDAW